MSNKPVVDALKQMLADNYALYLKTQNYHWNVEGPNFQSLHVMFEGQYTDLAATNDTAAELIRGLGEKVPASFGFYGKKTMIKAGNENASAEQMVKDLLKDHTSMQASLTKALHIAQKAGDEVAADFLIQRLTFHRKTAWMLESSL